MGMLVGSTISLWGWWGVGRVSRIFEQVSKADCANQQYALFSASMRKLGGSLEIGK